MAFTPAEKKSVAAVAKTLGMRKSHIAGNYHRLVGKEYHLEDRSELDSWLLQLEFRGYHNREVGLYARPNRLSEHVATEDIARTGWMEYLPTNFTEAQAMAAVRRMLRKAVKALERVRAGYQRRANNADDASNTLRDLSRIGERPSAASKRLTRIKKRSDTFLSGQTEGQLTALSHRVPPVATETSDSDAPHPQTTGT